MKKKGHVKNLRKSGHPDNIPDLETWTRFHVNSYGVGALGSNLIRFWHRGPRFYLNSYGFAGPGPRFDMNPDAFWGLGFRFHINLHGFGALGPDSICIHMLFGAWSPHYT